MSFIVDYLAPMLVPADLHDLLETSDVVGNIRFSHPTLYVFPGGQGDAALFGINGFNMLGKWILSPLKMCLAKCHRINFLDWIESYSL